MTTLYYTVYRGKESGLRFGRRRGEAGRQGPASSAPLRPLAGQVLIDQMVDLHCCRQARDAVSQSMRSKPVDGPGGRSAAAIAGRDRLWQATPSLASRAQVACQLHWGLVIILIALLPSCTLAQDSGTMRISARVQVGLRTHGIAVVVPHTATIATLGELTGLKLAKKVTLHARSTTPCFARTLYSAAASFCQRSTELFAGLIDCCHSQSSSLGPRGVMARQRCRSYLTWNRRVTGWTRTTK